MSDRLVVILEDVVAGTLTRLNGGRLRFDYDERYQEQSGGTPLSLSMPIQVRSHPDSVVSPWLWGLLPDNDAVLRRWAREYPRLGTSPFSLLATPVGEDCAGAVRFVTHRTRSTGSSVGSGARRVARRATTWPSGCASCARTPPRGSAGRSPASSASPERRRRRRCSMRTAAGASRRARYPPPTSSSRR